jgi:hypothetical protein
MTDAMTSQNIDLSSWDTLYFALKLLPIPQMHIQWNLGCRTTLISNTSVLEHKTKTKNAPVPEQANWQPGT